MVSKVAILISYKELALIVYKEEDDNDCMQQQPFLHMDIWPTR